MIPRHRLRGRRRFSAVRETGLRASAGVIRLAAAPNGGVDARVGFALPGHRGAVTRNLLRRRLREAIRPLLGSLRGHDVVLTAPSSAARVPWTQLAADVGAAVERLLRRSGRGQATSSSENGGVDQEQPS